MRNVDNIKDDEIISLFEFENYGTSFHKNHQYLAFNKVFLNQSFYLKDKIKDDILFLRIRIEELLLAKFKELLTKLRLKYLGTYKEILDYYKIENKFDKVIEKDHDDVYLYLLVDNNLHQFIKKYKNDFIKFAKEKDTTIFFYPNFIRYNNYFSFFCFNFIDVDNQEKVEDFWSNSFIFFEEKNSYNFIKICNILTKFASNKQELEDLNIKIIK